MNLAKASQQYPSVRYGVRSVPALLLTGALVFLAGCAVGPNGQPTWGLRPATPASQPATTVDAITSTPATQTQPVAEATTQPADPADKLAEQVQQYVDNLPMDDLQARLNRHDTPPAAEEAATQPAPVAEAAPVMEEPIAPQPAPAPQPKPAVAQAVPSHVPLQPEILEAPAPKPAEQPKPVEPKPSDTPVPPKDTRIVDIEISPAALASTSTRPAAKQQPNQSASANAGSSAGDLRDLLDQLRKEAANRPDSVGAALRLRLAEWSVLGKANPAEEWPLQDAEKRQLAESVWQVLQVVTQTDGQPQRAAGPEFEKALDALSETLRQVQPLKIPSAALCWSVANFANYEPLPEPWKFPAGQASMVVLYCELAGFRSEANKEKPGWYRALLGERLAILTSDGKELWNYDEPSIEDLCRRPRRDFFVTKKLRIPANLPAGPYVLKVTVRDLLANRVAETNVPFEIVAAK